MRDQRNLLLVQYHDSENISGFHLCSTRELAKQKALQFLSRCRIDDMSEDFGDYSDWDIGAIWYATIKGLGGSVTIYELTVDGDLVGSPDYPCTPTPESRKRPFGR